MRTANLVFWGFATLAAGVGFVAVVAFGWEPPPHGVAATAFIGAFYAFGARFHLTKANIE